MGKQPQEAATENQDAELSMKQATPPAMRRSAQLPTSSNAQQATRKNVRLLTNKSAQQAMKQATRSPVQQHTKRSAHLVGTAATTSAMPRTVASRSARRAGATEGSPLASGWRSKFAPEVVLTGLEVATVATMAEKQSQALCLV